MNSTRQNFLWAISLSLLLLVSVILYRTVSEPWPARPAVTAGSGQAVGDQEPASDPPPPDIVLKAETGRVSVIMYHDVVKPPIKNPVWFDCSAEEFEGDMEKIVK